MESTLGAGCRYNPGCHGVISFIRNSRSVFPKLRWLCHLTQLHVPSVVGGVRTGWSPLLAHLRLPASRAKGVDLAVPKPCIPNHHLHPKFHVISRRRAEPPCQIPAALSASELQGKEWKYKCNLHQEFFEQDTSGSSGHTKEGV